MKRILVVAITIGVLAASIVIDAKHQHRHGCNHEKVNVNKIVQALTKKCRINIKQYVSNKEWTWVEFDYFDEKYPLTIDILFSNKKLPERVIYLVAPSGYNFRCNYFTPQSHNIAHFMRKNGYLVIGITFREDHLPLDQADASITKWGLAKHRQDMHKVISAIQSVVPLPYELLGQAISAVCILDYAAHYSNPKFKRVIILDTDSFDPNIVPMKVEYAKLSYSAACQLINQGVYVNGFVKSMKDLIFAAMLYPEADSGQARPGLPGNFTYEGLLHFSLINTAYLPGLYTPLTGLPGEWVMIQGAAAGYYQFSQDPLDDDYDLLHTEIQTLALVANQIGEGSIPIALDRDMYAVMALNGAYTIDWSGIKEEVVMVNGQFSSGEQVYYGTQIRNAGNPNVTINVIPGYAYVDLLYGANAEQDVWRYFLD